MADYQYISVRASTGFEITEYVSQAYLFFSSENKHFLWRVPDSESHHTVVSSSPHKLSKDPPWILRSFEDVQSIIGTSEKRLQLCTAVCRECIFPDRSQTFMFRGSYSIVSIILLHLNSAPYLQDSQLLQCMYFQKENHKQEGTGCHLTNCKFFLCCLGQNAPLTWAQLGCQLKAYVFFLKQIEIHTSFSLYMLKEEENDFVLKLGKEDISGVQKESALHCSM